MQYNFSSFIQFMFLLLRLYFRKFPIGAPPMHVPALLWKFSIAHRQAARGKEEEEEAARRVNELLIVLRQRTYLPELAQTWSVFVASSSCHKNSKITRAGWPKRSGQSKEKVLIPSVILVMCAETTFLFGLQNNYKIKFWFKDSCRNEALLVNWWDRRNLLVF